MIRFQTKYEVGDQVSHLDRGSGEVKEITGQFSCRESTCSLELFYLVDFGGKIFKEQESSLSAQQY